MTVQCISTSESSGHIELSLASFESRDSFIKDYPIHYDESCWQWDSEVDLAQAFADDPGSHMIVRPSGATSGTGAWVRCCDKVYEQYFGVREENSGADNDVAREKAYRWASNRNVTIYGKSGNFLYTDLGIDYSNITYVGCGVHDTVWIQETGTSGEFLHINTANDIENIHFSQFTIRSDTGGSRLLFFQNTSFGPINSVHLDRMEFYREGSESGNPLVQFNGQTDHDTYVDRVNFYGHPDPANDQVGCKVNTGPTSPDIDNAFHFTNICSLGLGWTFESEATGTGLKYVEMDNITTDSSNRGAIKLYRVRSFNGGHFRSINVRNTPEANNINGIYWLDSEDNAAFHIDSIHVQQSSGNAVYTEQMYGASIDSLIVETLAKSGVAFSNVGSVTSSGGHALVCTAGTSGFRVGHLKALYCEGAAVLIDEWMGAVDPTNQQITGITFNHVLIEGNDEHGIHINGGTGRGSVQVLGGFIRNNSQSLNNAFDGIYIESTTGDAFDMLQVSNVDFEDRSGPANTQGLDINKVTNGGTLNWNGGRSDGGYNWPAPNALRINSVINQTDI